jgi:hypothetical protein
MHNSASKCLKITLKVTKFSKPENFSQKMLRGDIPLESFEWGGLSPLEETLSTKIGRAHV